MPKKALTFEQALTKLEELAASLEKGEMSLEDSLKAYEQGVALSAFCADTLKKARLKVSELQAVPEEPEEPEDPGDPGEPEDGEEDLLF